MLHLLDYSLTLFHTALVGFILFGWIKPEWRKIHLTVILLTLFSWLLIGLNKGVLGYCPLTDWHWQVKRMLGERGMPSSFIEYMLEKITGLDFQRLAVDITTGVCMAMASITALVLNYGAKKKRPEKHPA